MSSSSSTSSKGLYIALISVHGFIKAKPELGRDADTGGQVTYVLNLARALISDPRVSLVHLITRRIKDDKEEYAQVTEDLDDSGKCQIVRVDCAECKYLRKELLWPFLLEFVDSCVRVTHELAGRNPDIIHSHYADAGRVGLTWRNIIGVPWIHTGHSLGKDKIRALVATGEDMDEAEAAYNLSYRVSQEEKVLRSVDLIIASSNHERDTQYEQYDNYEKERCVVIPPGVALSSAFRPPKEGDEIPPYVKELERFLEKPEKPIILAICRATPKKNVKALIRAYGSSPKLQEAANLVLILGTREKINKAEESTAATLKEVLVLIDDYDLYNKVAYPKQHTKQDVGDLYRYAAQTKGVFVNVAHFEPFGLTILEAASSGLPVVATKNGGPADLVPFLKNGMLVHPTDIKGIKAALEVLLGDKEKWEACSKSGIEKSKSHSWETHASKYLDHVVELVEKKKNKGQDEETKTYYLPKCKYLLVTDLDMTLLNSSNITEAPWLDELKGILKKYDIGLGIATGRSHQATKECLSQVNLEPEFIISSVGSRIHYKGDIEDRLWHHHIDYMWNKEVIKSRIKEADLTGLKLQPKGHQKRHKISYAIEWDKLGGFSDRKGFDLVEDIEQCVSTTPYSCTVVYSHGAFIDILPVRAGKGMATRYLCNRWNVSLDRVVTAGDSGNDIDMLKGGTKGIVVGNYSPEMEQLKELPTKQHQIYFAKEHFGYGIIEGMKFWKIFENDEANGKK